MRSMFGSRSPERIGAVLCLVAGGSFALQPVLVRLAFDGGASVASVGAIRFALAAAVFALLARRRSPRRRHGRSSPRSCSA